MAKEHAGEEPASSPSRGYRFKNALWWTTAPVTISSALLRSCLDRNNLSCGPPKFESQDPFTRDIPMINFRRRKFPTARGLRGQIGKIPARPRGIERRSHDSA